MKGMEFDLIYSGRSELMPEIVFPSNSVNLYAIF